MAKIRSLALARDDRYPVYSTAFDLFAGIQFPNRKYSFNVLLQKRETLGGRQREERADQRQIYPVFAVIGKRSFHDSYCATAAGGATPVSCPRVMARFKPAGTKKAKPVKSSRGFIPCVIVILGGFALLFWLFYAVVNSGK